VTHQGEYASIAPRRRFIAAAVAVVMLISAFILAPTPSATAGSAGEVSAAAGVSAPQLPGGPVQTADLSKFQPGNIISDAVFFRSSTMTEAQIQAFLQAKVPSCQSGYTCLKDWYDTSRTTAADAMCGAYSGGVRERASRIIYKVAQACGINPQVFLVMLQKEQGLVTHTWPSTSRYTIAMGQGCPDTAACDTRYYGFFNQVYGAAWQLKRYANPPGTSNFFNWYAPGRTWNVRFHPNVSCGSAPVFIQNQATANLYYYTPYQPNAASLAAGYNEANDACSSYGNRNFFNYFTDWFGSTSGLSVSSIDTVSHFLAVGADSKMLAYPSNGKGAFLAPVSLEAATAGVARLLSPGDLDGDGFRDLITVGTDGKARILRGNGSLGYHEPTLLNVDWSGAVLITEAHDFSGDGIPDVFTTDSKGALLLWRGTGKAGFRAPVAVGNGWQTLNIIQAAGDMSGDGHPDLVGRRSTDGALILYRGNGRGGWLGSAQIGSGWGSMAAMHIPGDLNGDRKPELMGTDTAGVLWRWFGLGGGKFGAKTRIGHGMLGLRMVANPGPSAAGVRTFAPGPGDVDSDGYRDLVAVTPDNQVRLIRGNGAGGLVSNVPTGLTVPAGSRLFSLGDFDSDGVADLGMIDAGGLFYRISGNGAGGYAAPVQIGNGWNTLNLVFGGIDYDGDRHVDVIGRDAAGLLKLYRGNGAGGWVGTVTQIGNGWSGMTAMFAVGDFDGDQAPDIIARTAEGYLNLYSTTGAGGWKRTLRIGNGWGHFTALYSAGNLDRAGGPDIVAALPTGTLMLYRGSGTGGWGAVSALGYGWSLVKWAV
jgi:hypothetical protein